MWDLIRNTFNAAAIVVFWLSFWIALVCGMYWVASKLNDGGFGMLEEEITAMVPGQPSLKIHKSVDPERSAMHLSENPTIYQYLPGEFSELFSVSKTDDTLKRWGPSILRKCYAAWFTKKRIEFEQGGPDVGGSYVVGGSYTLGVEHRQNRYRK